MATIRRTPVAVAASGLVALALAACGTQQVEISSKDPMRRGAVLFDRKCAGCHNLTITGSQGGAFQIEDRERVDGPSFDARKESTAQVLYAIRNGGVSGPIMPEKIVTGEDADAVAQFLAKYSGREATKPPTPEAEQSQSP